MRQSPILDFLRVTGMKPIVVSSWFGLTFALCAIVTSWLESAAFTPPLNGWRVHLGFGAISFVAGFLGGSLYTVITRRRGRLRSRRFHVVIGALGGIAAMLMLDGYIDIELYRAGFKPISVTEYLRGLMFPTAIGAPIGAVLGLIDHRGWLFGGSRTTAAA